MGPKYHILFFTVLYFFCEEIVKAQNADCQCGRKTDHSFRIVGGKVAQPNSYPWLAAISHKWFKIIFCGGALINDRYVITAGHCVKSFPQRITVFLGLHDTNKKNDALEVGVNHALLHKDFKDNGINDINDIALLKLNKVVTFTNKIKPICLPTDPERTYSGEVAQVAGWGKTHYRFGEPSHLLKETDLNVVSQDNCKKNRIIQRYLLDTMLCAYRAGTDTCQGDSGGPLTYETPSGKNEIIGIVSWGLECAKPDSPGVYTRVTSYLDWIAKNTKDAVYCKN